MIRFNIAGEYLELPADFSLQFQKKNLLFAFDSIECERSTSFDIPATPTNDRIFALAKWIASPGTGMRRRYSAQMQASMVTKDGYLYVDSYSPDSNGGKYKAIFVTGELLGLKNVREAGKLNAFLQYNYGLTWNLSNIKDANAGSLSAFDLVRYSVANSLNVAPSASVKSIIEDAVNQLGISIDWTNVSDAAAMRIFRNSGLKVTDTEVHLTNDPNESQDPINLGSFLGITQFVNSAMYSYGPATTDMDESGYFWVAPNRYQDQFQALQLPYECVIEFPRDFPSNYFLASTFDSWYYDSSRSRYDQPDAPKINFLGGWRFGWNGVGYGQPLAGRKVTIPANTPFLLITPDVLLYNTPASGSTADYIGMDASRVPAYDFTVKITIEDAFEIGDKVPYNAILPDITLIELLQAVAAVSGTVLDYENDTIKFEPLDMSGWNLVELSDIISRSDIRRIFADYAQKNTVKFDSGSSVLAGDVIETNYYVDNDNLDASKELQVLSVSEGAADPSVPTRVYIRNEDDSTPTLALADSDTYMERVGLPQNDGLVTLCDASTSVTIKVSMSLLQFQLIAPKTKIYDNGVLYVWTEAQWTKGQATLKLSKISA